MVDPRPSDLRDCETSPSSISCPPTKFGTRHRPGFDPTGDWPSRPCRARQDLQHPTNAFQGAGRWAAVSPIHQRGQWVHMRNSFVAGGPIPGPKHRACRTRRGDAGGRLRNDTQHGPKQCPDHQSSRGPTARKGLAFGAERPPNSRRRRRPHMIRTLHARDTGRRSHSTPTGVQSLRGLIPAAFCRPQFDARVP